MTPSLPSQFTLRQAAWVEDIAHATAARRAHGDGDGTLLLAGEHPHVQLPTGGSWHSPQGNLHIGLLLEPDLDVALCGDLSHVLLHAIGSAIAELVAPGTQLHHDRKGNLYLNGLWAGRFEINLPKTNRAPHSHCPWLVMAALVNVAHHPPNPQPERYNSVLACGADPQHLLARLLEMFSRHLLSAINRWTRHGGARLAESWRSRTLGGQEGAELDIIKTINLPPTP